MLSYEAVGIACLCALVMYTLRVTVGNRIRHMPGPRGLPIVGSFLSIDWSKLHLHISEWHSKYGPVMRIHLMAKDIVIISSAEAVKEALVSRGLDFEGTPSVWRLERLGLFKGIITGKLTPFLIEVKHAMLHHLRGSHLDGLDRMERILMDGMTDFLDQIASYKDQPIEAKIETRKFLCNQTTSLVFGEQYPSDHPHFEGLMQFNIEILDMITEATESGMLDRFPWLRFTGMFAEEMKQLRRVESLRDTIILERVKQERASFSPISHRGIIHDMLSRSLKAYDKKSQVVWNDEEITAYIIGLFVAGNFTSLNLIQAAYIVLLKHQELQSKIQQEIDRIIGNSDPSLKHRAHMPYTEAFLLEIVRSFISPMIYRNTLKDTSVGGYFVPSKTEVLINTWDIHHDETIYPLPFEFRPERFLDHHGQLHSHDHPSRENLFTFGAGHRSCLGEHFARARLFLVVVSLLQRFTIREDVARPAPDPDPRNCKLIQLIDIPACFFVAASRKQNT